MAIGAYNSTKNINIQKLLTLGINRHYSDNRLKLVHTKTYTKTGPY